MLLTKRWNEDNLTEECFYESQNVFYSACLDKVNDYKQLTIVFKNGAQYVYNDIDVNDYLMFRNAQSQGKALNEFITIKRNGKAKYTYERMTPVNVEDYQERLRQWLNEDKQSNDNNTEATNVEAPATATDNTARVIVEISPKSYTIKVGEVIINGFDTETLGKMSLLLDTLQINYTKTFIRR